MMHPVLAFLAAVLLAILIEEFFSVFRYYRGRE